LRPPSATRNAGKPDIVGFTSQVIITEDALSKRYVQKAGS